MENQATALFRVWTTSITLSIYLSSKESKYGPENKHCYNYVIFIIFVSSFLIIFNTLQICKHESVQAWSYLSLLIGLYLLYEAYDVLGFGSLVFQASNSMDVSQAIYSDY